MAEKLAMDVAVMDPGLKRPLTDDLDSSSAKKGIAKFFKLAKRADNQPTDNMSTYTVVDTPSVPDDDSVIKELESLLHDDNWISATSQPVASAQGLPPSPVWSTSVGDVSATEPNEPACGDIETMKLTAQNIEMWEKQCKDDADKVKMMLQKQDGTPLAKREAKKLLQLEKACAAGFIDPRTAIGQKILQQLKDKTTPDGAAYAKCKREEAQAFRLEFAKRELKNFREEKVYNKSYQRVDITKGEYMNLAQLVKSEGGWEDPQAVEGVRLLVSKCMQMGEPWTMVHPQTERMTYLKLKFEFKEEFAEKWGLFKNEFNDSVRQVRDSKQGPEGPDSTTPRTNKGDPDGTPSNASGQMLTGNTPTKGTQPAEANKQVAKMWQEAAKLKNKILSSKAAADEVLKAIGTNPAWAWANNPENVGELRGAVAQLSDSQSAFHKEFITSGSKPLKKKHDEATCICELKAFMATEKDLNHMISIHDLLVRRHMLS